MIGKTLDLVYGGSRLPHKCLMHCPVPASLRVTLVFIVLLNMPPTTEEKKKAGAREIGQVLSAYLAHSQSQFNPQHHIRSP